MLWLTGIAEADWNNQEAGATGPPPVADMGMSHCTMVVVVMIGMVVVVVVVAVPMLVNRGGGGGGMCNDGRPASEGLHSHCYTTYCRNCPRIICNTTRDGYESEQ